MQIVYDALDFLQKNSGGMIFAVCVLLLLTMLGYLRQIKKINQKMNVLEKNIDENFEKLPERFMEKSEKSEVEIAKKVKQQKVAEEEERKQKAKKQQEAVFDAVLQEIFP